MAKQQLSPEKYITTKARSLPIYKCYVTSNWEESQVVTVVVMRQHVNGNVTAGMYLVDLLCLGVKDTFYAFNIDRKEAEERFVDPLFEAEEAEYNLAHNLVYAAHDFALEFDIKPHKDFNITKYILEEDTDKIPVIEIPVGDENGNPSLVVDSSYNYGPVLQKLKQNAGEGNYTFVLQDDVDEEDFDEDDEDVDDEDFDEDEFDKDDFDDEDFEDDDDDDHVFMDFNVISKLETEELEELIEEESESYSDLVIVNTELLFRRLYEEENSILPTLEEVRQEKDYQLLEKKREQWEKAAEDNEARIEKIFPKLQALRSNENELSQEDLMTEGLKLLQKNKTDDMIAFMIVNSLPLLTVLSEINRLENNFEQYSPAIQLFIAAYVVLLKKEPGAKYDFLLNASTVEMAYPFNRHIHGLHHKLFWLLKAIYAIQQDDKTKLLHYHNLLRVSGTGGNIKYMYATMLESQLKNYLGITPDEDKTENDDSLDYEMVDDEE